MSEEQAILVGLKRIVILTKVWPAAFSKAFSALGKLSLLGVKGNARLWVTNFSEKLKDRLYDDLQGKSLNVGGRLL